MVITDIDVYRVGRENIVIAVYNEHIKLLFILIS
ncbi:TPA: hypothetical protein O6X65_001448 [Staphylococcus aureus]|uniref:Uncharacterized protein n=1 Tax=Staphylococcus aureus TaxID=1280 RepID=A0A2U0IN76_STAAU|nr:MULTISPECIES: hypothetical protein [Staphylococcus]HAR4217398.1 hypothetical protein [Staphylococcus aureus ADL-227]HAR4240118.1 hypothetical protein [Staphylococcus aureus ADL-330]HDH6185393.1 hypothetical protein [Staphylococcus aureus LTCF-17-69]HDH6188113.1 hypothetical protein [Staphylococcus aureus LTCF-17-67]HDH6190989.1 hypothetical protein [Staphylococcus aureus LTCF-17-68]HDH6192792.1 hypothetical protein [Staphylococcus aureus LTCF-16-66]HDH6196455.1 hypothetical protein [Staph